MQLTAAAASTEDPTEHVSNIVTSSECSWVRIRALCVTSSLSDSRHQDEDSEHTGPEMDALSMYSGGIQFELRHWLS
jgi:hypothetical protein